MKKIKTNSYMVVTASAFLSLVRYVYTHCFTFIFMIKNLIQVSPIVRMGCDDEMGPPWLVPMLRANYFVPCSIHGDSSKSECNLYCLDCMGPALCSYCLINHRDHRVFQVISTTLCSSPNEFQLNLF